MLTVNSLVSRLFMGFSWQRTLGEAISKAVSWPGEAAVNGLNSLFGFELGSSAGSKWLKCNVNKQIRAHED